MIGSNPETSLENQDNIDLKDHKDHNKELSDLLNSFILSGLKYDDRNFSNFISSFFNIITHTNKTEGVRKILQNFFNQLKPSISRQFEAKLEQSFDLDMRTILTNDQSTSHDTENNKIDVLSILVITETYLMTKVIITSSLLYQITSFILRYPLIQSLKLLTLLHPRNIHDSSVIFHGLIYFITHYINEFQDLEKFDEYCLKTMKNAIYPVEKQIVPLFAVKLISFLKFFSQFSSIIPKFIDFYFEIILSFFETDYRSISTYREPIISYYKSFYTSISFIKICKILKINFEDLKQYLDTENEEEKISIECSLIRLNPSYEKELENINNSSCKRIFSLLETNENSLLFLEKFKTKYQVEKKEMVDVLVSSDNIDLICWLLNKQIIEIRAFTQYKQKMAEILKNYEKNYDDCEKFITNYIIKYFVSDSEMTYFLTKYLNKEKIDYNQNFANFKKFFVKEKNFKCSENFFDLFKQEISDCVNDLLTNYSNDQLLVSILKHDYKNFKIHSKVFDKIKNNKNVEFIYHIFKTLLEQNSFITKDENYRESVINQLTDFDPEIRFDFTKLFFPKVKQNLIIKQNQNIIQSQKIGPNLNIKQNQNIIQSQKIEQNQNLRQNQNIEQNLNIKHNVIQSQKIGQNVIQNQKIEQNQNAVQSQTKEQNSIHEIDISKEYKYQRFEHKVKNFIKLADEIDDGSIDDDYLNIKLNKCCSKLTKLNLSRFVYFNKQNANYYESFHQNIFFNSKCHSLNHSNYNDLFSMYFMHKEFLKISSGDRYYNQHYDIDLLQLSMIRLNDYYVNHDEYFTDKIYQIISMLIVDYRKYNEECLKQFANVFTRQQILDLLERDSRSAKQNDDVINIYQLANNSSNLKNFSEDLPIKVIDSIISREDFEFKEIKLDYLMKRDLPDHIETKISQKCQKLRKSYSKVFPNFNDFSGILNYFIRPMLQEFGSISYHIGYYILNICDIIEEKEIKHFVPIPNTSLGNFNVLSEISEEEKEDFSFIKTPNDIAIEMFRNHKDTRYRSLVFGCTCSLHLSKYLLIHVFDDIRSREENFKKLTKIINFLLSKEHQGTNKILNFIFSLYPTFYNKEFNIFKNNIINQNDLISTAMKMQKYEICLRHIDSLDQGNQLMFQKIYSNLDDFDNLEYFYSSMFQEKNYNLVLESYNSSIDEKLQVLKYLEHQGMYNVLKLFSLRLMNQYPANDEIIGFVAKLAINTEDFDLMKDVSEKNSKDFYSRLINFILDFEKPDSKSDEKHKEYQQSLKEYIDELNNKYFQGNFNNLQIIENQISILRSIYDQQFKKQSDNDLSTVVSIIINKKLDSFCQDVIKIYFNLIKKLRKEESLDKAEFYSKNAMIYASEPHWSVLYKSIQVRSMLEQLKISIMKNDQKNSKIISQRLSEKLALEKQSMSKEYMKFQALLAELEIKEHSDYKKSQRLIEEGMKDADEESKTKYRYLLATVCDKLFIKSLKFEYFKLTIDNYFSALASEKDKRRLDIIPRLFDLLFRIGSKYFSFLIPDQGNKVDDEEEEDDDDDENDDFINKEIQEISDEDKKNFYNTIRDKINNCTHQISISAESIIPLLDKISGKLSNELMRILNESFLQEGLMSIWHFFILIEENEEFNNLIGNDPNTSRLKQISKNLIDSYPKKPTNGVSNPYVFTTAIRDDDPINKSLEQIQSKTAIVPTSNNLHSYKIDYMKRIDKVKATRIFGSKCKPMELEFTSDIGDKYLFLLKEGKDLEMRKDMRIMDIFTFINSVFNLDAFCKNRHLNITTYAVIILNKNFSLIELVPDSIEMKNVYTELYTNFVNIRNEYQKRIKNEQSFAVNSENFKNQFSHPLKEWFCLQFKEPKKWFSAQKEYTMSCAVLSWVGSIFQIDDRHLGNILLKRETGTVFHIDFEEILESKIAADFRLTHIILDGLGICGVNGSFTKCCIITANNLKANRDALVSLMEGFIDVEFEPEKSQEILDQLKKRVDMIADDGHSSISPEQLVYSKISYCQQLKVLYEKNGNWSSFM
ncbi:PIKK family atypical protein kinase [Trichomonas vaginalis G3]|uniref:PIKK family atypical protein kinase n=1 Tax=Trichomonas vaginalis (strain ATCC PRA-98 / G3) TaxID=412133 RepID=A2DX13_TRIV3|nr:ataxia telangiectasia mutated (ATM) -related family [Trichomonas vaginalis G3]EAY15040.1 PIKK family atypical protein kinase [Trichomonas vaginalis G3]KAI5549581.1 ataxia telangiectasia mutated (ATM) -related family [Trichomonas vaginalis G3]|eukprot:XP_001327263.1 PIKK family atypical protein kinase [Trichomonas vaginalis G3]